jgi:hypothetical protein
VISLAQMGSEEFKIAVAAIVLVVGFIAAGGVLYPLARAYARRLERGEAGSGPGAEAVEDLRARVADLEAQQGRVLELEERVDFAERLLAQQRLPTGTPGREARADPPPEPANAAE